MSSTLEGRVEQEEEIRIEDCLEGHYEDWWIRLDDWSGSLCCSENRFLVEACLSWNCIDLARASCLGSDDGTRAQLLADLALSAVAAAAAAVGPHMC